MNNKSQLNIQESLCRALNQCPQLDVDELLAMPVVKLSQHDFISQQEPLSKPKPARRQAYLKPVTAVVACLMVMLVCLTSYFSEFKIADTIIALDGKQSIEIVTNKQRQILSVRAFDEKVQTALDENNWDQVKLEDSVSVILGSLNKKGYCQGSNKVVMVSVENQNAQAANDLAAAFDQAIKNNISGDKTATTVYQQVVTADQATAAQAAELNVSTGKLNIIQKMISQDPSLSMDSLASLSMTELMELSKEKAVDLTDIIEGEDQQAIEDLKNSNGDGQTENQPVEEVAAEKEDEEVVEEVAEAEKENEEEVEEVAEEDEEEVAADAVEETDAVEEEKEVEEEVSTESDQVEESDQAEIPLQTPTEDASFLEQAPDLSAIPEKNNKSEKVMQ